MAYLDHPPFTPDDYRALLADMAERASDRAVQCREQGDDLSISWSVVAAILRVASEYVPSSVDSSPTES
jgi:hypothetical protein